MWVVVCDSASPQLPFYSSDKYGLRAVVSPLSCQSHEGIWRLKKNKKYHEVSS